MSENSTESQTTEHESTGNESTEKSTDEGNLHVTDHGGDGRPVVLIHGWPLSEDSWSAQVPALKEAGHRVVTYDRRGFGSSGPGDAYDYDKLAGDLDNVLSELDLHDAVVVGFSMGGGEVARYIGAHGEDRLSGAVFAGAIPPALVKTDDNPDGPLEQDAAGEMRKGLEDDRDAFFDDFTTSFFSVDGDLKVSEEQRQEALEVCKRSDERAALECMDAWATDFRGDLEKVTVPTLVIHGDGDGIVPFEGSGKRTHEAIEGSTLVVVEGGPHGFNASHADEFNRALLDFLQGIDGDGRDESKDEDKASDES